MEIQFRQARKADMDIVLEMMSDFSAIDQYPFDMALRKENLSTFIGNHELGRLWIICHQNEIVGYMVLAYSFSFEFKGRDAFIDELYLKENYRSKGTGGKALDFILLQAHELGVKAIHLEVEIHNEKGNKLYFKKGFKNHNRILMTKFMDNK